MNDTQLIDGCIRRSRTHWNAFVGRFSRLIYWSIRRALRGSEFAGRDELREEIFQEVFRRLLERETLARLKDVRTIRRFLSVMACRMALDAVRNLKRRTNILTLDPPDADPESDEGFDPVWEFEDEAGTPSSIILSREQSEIIAGTLSALPHQERTCLEFHYLEGKSHRQIALILGMTQDAVSGTIYRTREKLKTLFAEKGLGS